MNFWDFEAWGGINLIAILLLSLLAANMLKKLIRPLQESLIPTSVLGGIMLLIVSSVYTAITDKGLFDTSFFGGNGADMLEVLTYHALALGFIASTLRNTEKKLTKKRGVEIFNTGVTTVSTYLIQAVVGLGVTIVYALIRTDFFAGAGVLLPFGYGQGTGQALNYGTIYEADFGFVGGKSFGLTVAALGFLSASIGGVFYLWLIRRKIRRAGGEIAGEGVLMSEQIQGDDEIPMNGSMDKLTVQVAFVLVTYLLTYLLLFALGMALPGMKSVIYGFNFLFGVILATAIKLITNTLHRKGVIKKQYLNSFLMNRVSGFFFDLMVVAGIAAIRLDVLKSYWGIMLVLGAAGLVITYAYNRFVAKRLFPEYADAQFLGMYGMLTGTASTGIILLREMDPEFETPVADNLVYQNFPAIVFGFPIMLLAADVPKHPALSLLIFAVFFLVMNLILFRSKIFRRRNKKGNKR